MKYIISACGMIGIILCIVVGIQATIGHLTSKEKCYFCKDNGFFLEKPVTSRDKTFHTRCWSELKHRARVDMDLLYDHYEVMRGDIVDWIHKFVRTR